MVNINLTTEKITVKEPRLFKREVVVLFVILAILVVSYGGMIIYQGVLIKRTDQKIAEYQLLYKELTEGNTKDVFDFQNRLSLANGLLSGESATLNNLTNIQSVIIPKTFITSFSFDATENKITLNCVADNYDTMAKQILSFKKSGLFSDVKINSSEFSENSVSFPVTLTNN